MSQKTTVMTTVTTMTMTMTTTTTTMTATTTTTATRRSLPNQPLQRSSGTYHQCILLTSRQELVRLRRPILRPSSSWQEMISCDRCGDSVGRLLAGPKALVAGRATRRALGADARLATQRGCLAREAGRVVPLTARDLCLFASAQPQPPPTAGNLLLYTRSVDTGRGGT